MFSLPDAQRSNQILPEPDNFHNADTNGFQSWQP